MTQEHPPNDQPEPADGPPKIASRGKLLFGTALFLVLTIGVFWYQFAKIDDTSGPTWGALRWEYALLILLFLPLEPLAGGARIWVVCRILQPGVSFWTCFKAETANVGFSMLTPSQSGGGPAQIYLLSRDGDVNLGTAFTISMISFMGTLITLMLIGLYAKFGTSDGGPDSALFSAAVYSVTSSVGLSILGALWPGLFRFFLAPLSRSFNKLFRRTDRIADWRRPNTPTANTSTDRPALDRMGPLMARIVNIIYVYHDDMFKYLKTGKITLIYVIVCTLTFLFGRFLMAYLAVRFLGIEASLMRVIEIQAVLVFVIYFAPTPGSAGIAEGVSLAAMGSIVSAGFAPYYNLIWRCSTLYVSAIAGLIFVVRAIVRDARSALEYARTAIRDRQGHVFDGPLEGRAASEGEGAEA